MIREKLTKEIKRITGNENIRLDQPSVKEHGDYALSLALEESKRQNRNPRELAEEIKAKILGDKDISVLVEKIEIAGPGFINFWIKDKALVEEIDRSLGFARDDNSRKIIVEYSSPNIAKRFSVGHFRSTVIGQAIYNLQKFTGNNVWGINHVGDWGTQFGVILAAIEKSKTDVSNINLEVLEKLYVDYTQKMKDNPVYRENGREWFKKLEEGDHYARNIWKRISEESFKEFDKLYAMLGVHIDEVRGESFYDQIEDSEYKMQSIITEAKEKGISSVGEGGAIIIELGSMVPGMLVKSNGTTTYFTRDLAAIKYRVQVDGADKIIYEVGSEQILHFRQVFAAAKLFDWGKNIELVHVSHGLVRLPEGKMSTRKGNTIKLDELISQSIEKASAFNQDSKISKMVGIGALKYNDLKRSPEQEIVFDWNEILSMQGNSGPYIQYTYARTQSVLEKVESPKVSNFKFQIGAAERALTVILSRYHEMIVDASESYSPNLLCNYLYELSKEYNAFYSSQKIIGSEEEIQRLWLTKKTGKVIKSGLELLGIGAPQKM